jgi:hypothetical protein
LLIARGVGWLLQQQYCTFKSNTNELAGGKAKRNKREIDALFSSLSFLVASNIYRNFINGRNASIYTFHIKNDTSCLSDQLFSHFRRCKPKRLIQSGNFFVLGQLLLKSKFPRLFRIFTSIFEFLISATKLETFMEL